MHYMTAVIDNNKHTISSLGGTEMNCSFDLPPRDGTLTKGKFLFEVEWREGEEVDVALQSIS